MGRYARVTSTDSPASTPTIAVMPGDCYILRANRRPPVGKLFARDIERRRRHQMVKDDCVLLAPAKAGDRLEVIIVEKMPRHRGPTCRAVQGTINQFGSCEHNCRGNFGKL